MSRAISRSHGRPVATGIPAPIGAGTHPSTEEPHPASGHERPSEGKVKTREEAPSHGHVVRLFPEDGHGIIETSDGREIHFGRDCLAIGDFDRLTVGVKVRFAEMQGENGPQASAVHCAGRADPGAWSLRRKGGGGELP